MGSAIDAGIQEENIRSWSESGPGFDEADFKSTYRSLSRRPRTGQDGALFKMAREHGWRDTAPIHIPSPAERELRRVEAERKASEAAAEEARRHEAAMRTGREILDGGKLDPTQHPYWLKKGANLGKSVRRGPWPQRGWDDALLIPAYDSEQRLSTIEAINADGTKDSLSGGRKRGAIVPIKPFRTADVVVVGEGVATSAIAAESLAVAGVAALGAGNMVEAGKIVRGLNLTGNIVFVADHDPSGTGLVHAKRAAAEVSGFVVDLAAMLPDAKFDAWDVANRLGLDELGRAINRAIKAGPVQAEAEPADEQAGGDGVPGSEESVAQMQEDGRREDPVERVAGNIRSRLVKALEIDPTDAERTRRLGIDTAVIGRMIRGSFWSGSKSKLFLLNDSQSLNQFRAGEAYKFLVRTFGSPVDAQAIADLTEEAISAQTLDKTQEKALRRAVTDDIGTVIIDHLKHHNQREGVEWRCDMFAEGATMHLLEDKAQVVLAHKPFEASGPYEQAIIDDYKQHFTRLDDFLEFLVQSRFALDRKKCYLWILADSDWGKGFLLGVLNTLRISVSTSMKEIEAMFEGRPVGRAPEDFKRAFALVVDEFKTVKSELKQLQSEITLSPKNQLTASVEVFAKLFLSAESVASLVTENGVEDQFANRMSIFEESGSLVKRPLYIEVGNPRYFASVLAYSAETMNRMVAKMQAMGRDEAQTHAERWINEFIKRNGIDTVYDRFSDSLPEVAADAVRWMHNKHGIANDYLLKDDGKYYLASPSKRLEEYLFEHFDASEVHAYRRRKTEILKSMSHDGKGVYPYTIKGHQTKAVLLKRISESDHPLHY